MAFDESRIFRVLYFLSEEPSGFLLAQDAFPTIDSCLTQLHELMVTINGFRNKVSALSDDDDDGPIKASYEHLIDRAEALLEREVEILPALGQLADCAVKFWFCAPIDSDATSCAAYTQLWEDHKDGQAISDTLTSEMDRFKALCAEHIRILFPDLLVTLKREEEENKTQLESITPLTTTLLNGTPVLCQRDIFLSQGTFISACGFPTSHYCTVSRQYAQLIGYSIPRLFAIPISILTINNMELDNVVKGLNNRNDPEKVVLLHRTVTRDVLTIHWEICPALINGVFTAVGTNVTDEIEVSRNQQSGNIQRMLRQWLHSIRNASFEQQALILLDEINQLKAQMVDEKYASKFESLTTGLRTLVHTAKTSVGLIDQALETKGLVHMMSIGDFLNNLFNFPRNFAVSEGLGVMPIVIDIYLDGVKVLPAAICDLFVKCDVVSIQAFVDNIVSNAVRYTDPELGIALRIDIFKAASKLRFHIYVTDYCSDGFPESAVNFLRNRIDGLKVLDHRSSKNINDTWSSGSSGSVLEKRNPSLFEASSPSMKRMRISGNEEAVSETAASASVKNYVRISSASEDSENIVCGIVSAASEKVSKKLTSRKVSIGSATMEDAFLASGKGRSTGTGLPHLLGLYNQLSHSGEDFDFSLRLNQTGSTLKLSFEGVLSAPAKIFANEEIGDDLATLNGIILGVDDSAVIRKIFAKHFIALGIKYHLCVDGADALAWLKEHINECCGIITDLEMPKMGGNELIGNIHELFPQLPCFIASGNDVSPLDLPPGARRSILKPVSFEDVASIVKEIWRLQHLAGRGM